MNVRDLFPGYYQPTEEDFKELWKECVFSFDTNVLLHIYRYSPNTRERLFDILQNLQERIWIPHQVGYEFHENRLSVISQQHEAYDKIGKILEENLKLEKLGTLKKELDAYKSHSTIEVKTIIGKIESAIKEIIKPIKEDLQISKQKHPELIKNDEFQDKMLEILNGRIGSAYVDKSHIYNLAEERFKYFMPPGYEDIKDKPIPDRYGDAILWLQLIDYAKTQKNPIIFVTDDSKKDWWLEHKGKTIGPRPELVQEMLTEAGVKFHMYQCDRFLEYAEDFLKLPEQPEVVEEAREMREQNTISQAYVNVISEISQLLLAGDKLRNPITEQNQLISAEVAKLINPITEQNQLISAEVAKLINPITKLVFNPDDYKLP